MPGQDVVGDVNAHIAEFESSSLKALLAAVSGEPRVIKYVSAARAVHYQTDSPLWISSTPALTWGTATYVTPLAFPLSSALYGRIGLVAVIDPSGWRVFDATSHAAKASYIRWTRTQPDFRRLLLTVHSTYSNHAMRDRFRRQFGIDCVIFRPDQRAEMHTYPRSDVWMAVTDWTGPSRKHIAIGPSTRIGSARFTVLVDEEFALQKDHLPTRRSPRLIEPVTDGIPGVLQQGERVKSARVSPTLPDQIAQAHSANGYIHLWIEP